MARHLGQQATPATLILKGSQHQTLALINMFEQGEPNPSRTVSGQEIFSERGGFCVLRSAVFSAGEERHLHLCAEHCGAVLQHLGELGGWEPGFGYRDKIA